MLSRTNLADAPRHSSLNSRPVNLLRPLYRRQKSQLLWNQANPASFCKTPGVGVPPQTSPLESATSSLFFSGPVITQLRGSRRRPRCTPICSPFVFITIRIAFPATPFFSEPSALPGGVGYHRSYLLFGARFRKRPYIGRKVGWRDELAATRGRKMPPTHRGTRVIVAGRACALREGFSERTARP